MMSPAIEIIFTGTSDHQVRKDERLIRSHRDYVKLCSEFSKKRSSFPKKVWVRQKSHFLWFQAFVEQIQLECIYKELTPRSILAEKWQSDIPDWVTDEIVDEEHLLELTPPDRLFDSFTDSILFKFTNVDTNLDNIDQETLAHLAVAICGDEYRKALSVHPILDRCLEEKCALWKSLASKGMQTTLHTLLSNPERLWGVLTIVGLLSNYPDRIIDYALSPREKLILKEFQQEQVKNFPLRSATVEEVIGLISEYMQEMSNKINNEKSFVLIIDQTSGQLAAEFQHLKSIICKGLPFITEELVRRLQVKFNSCQGIDSSELESLKKYIPAKRPGPDCDSKWEVSNWIEWITKDYLPYREWQIHTDQFDDEVERSVKMFSDWYISNYTTIQSDENYSLVSALGQLGEMNVQDSLVIVLVLDCLPINYWRNLNTVLAEAGLHLHSSQYRFAPLPSDTLHCKPQFLSGDPSLRPDEKDEYKVLVSKRFKSDFGLSNIQYTNKISDLDKLSASSVPDVFVVNSIVTDSILHEDVELKASTYDEELYRLFKRIAQSLYDLNDRLRPLQKKLTIIVATDHGACQIMSNELLSVESQTASKLFTSDKARYTLVKREDLKQIPANFWDHAHKFTNPFITGGDIYAIPNGHDTLRRPMVAKAHMHGGCSPEEVLVPFAIYKTKPVDYQPLKIRPVEIVTVTETGRVKFYLKRMSVLKLELMNPNMHPAKTIRTALKPKFADLRTSTSSEIEAGQRVVHELGLYFDKINPGEYAVDIEIEYEINNVVRRVLYTLECDIRSATQTGFNLRDL